MKRVLANLLSGLLLLLTLTSSLALADAEHATKLFRDLANAMTQMEGRQAEDELWKYWFDQSPSTQIRSFLDKGIERREAYDFEAAEIHLDKVVADAPDYSEGYNQRAFVRFLRENFEGAQVDLEKALELEPRHFGAMSGLFHILRIQNRQQAALGLLQQAVTIHPWLKERSALPENMWPEGYKNLHAPDQGI